MSDEAVAGDTGEAGGGETFDARAAAAELSERRAQQPQRKETDQDQEAAKPIDVIEYPEDNPKFERRTTRQAAKDLSDYRAQLAARFNEEPEAAPAAERAAEPAPDEQQQPQQSDELPQTPHELVSQAESLIRSENAEERAAAVKLLATASERGHHELRLATADAYTKVTSEQMQIVAAALLANGVDLDPADLAARDPARLANLQKLGATYQNLQKCVDAAKLSGEQVRAQQWQSWADIEDAKASRLIPEANDPAFKTAATNALTSYGFTPQELVGAYTGKEQFSLRDSRVQRIVADAVKHQQASLALKNLNNNRAPSPPVQRPGVSRPFLGSETDSTVRSLNSKLSHSGNLKDAAKLLAARRRAGA